MLLSKAVIRGQSLRKSFVLNHAEDAFLDEK